MLLFKEAHRQHYDYYHMVSGGDLPLKNNTALDAFFDENAGLEFIQYDEERLKSNPEIARRTKYYHFLQNYRRRYKKTCLNSFFIFLKRISLVCQIVFNVNRLKDIDWTIKYGSNWVSITDDLVEEILKQEDMIERVFSCTNCADELFVQTISYNCGYSDRTAWGVQRHRGEGSTKIATLPRYFDWERGKNGNPYTFTISDYSELRSVDALFARKFSESVDKEIIEKVLKLRMQSEI